MSGGRLLSRRGVAVVVLGLGSVLLALAEERCLADRIVLRGGGQVRGKVLPDPSRPDRVTVLTETTKTPLSFQKAQVVEVIPEPSALDEYVRRRAEAGPDAQAQYELGLWCEERKLSGLATLHYEAAVARDKAFAPAHQKLGHVQQGDRWLTADELREAQGLVRYKGRWVTKEERDQREERAATGQEQASWVRRIRVLRQVIAAGPEDRSRAAEQQLLEIREPVAVSPLVRVLGQDTHDFRRLLDQVLAAIPGPEAAAALVGRILAEADAEVRQSTLAALERRPEDVVPNLVRGLRSTSPEVVNRAAWALANLNAVTAVPRLIPALITTQYRVVWTSNGGGGSPPLGVGGLGSVPPTGGAPIFYNGSSVGVLTGPVVGPGVVAYGAAAVPAYGAVPYVPYGGASLSIGSAPDSRGPTPKLVAYSYQNVEVLSALVKLTGRDFGYDIPTWRRWVSTSFRPDTAPARRVPQP